MRRANPPSRREKPEAAKKILLGGVFPAGDMVKAAELRYAAESLRRVFPKAELHIAGENGVPAYGFPGGVPVEQLRETIRQYDAFGWIGTPVSGGELMPGAELLEFASHHGVAAFVWGVGLERGATAESGAERGRGGVFSRRSWRGSPFSGGSANGSRPGPVTVWSTVCVPAGSRLLRMRRLWKSCAGISAASMELPAPIRCCWPRRRCCRQMSS